MGKIKCKFKDEIKANIPVSEKVANKPNACYVSPELTCLRQTRVLVIFKPKWNATCSRKLLELKPFQQK